MHLREGEKILRVFRHHPTPFVFDLLKVVAAALPFFIILYALRDGLSTKWFILWHVILLAVFSLVMVYLSLIYWLDKLVITNFRIVHIDWKYLTIRNEAEALLDDIQDVQTHEKGLLSYFRVFDYGTLKLDTASSYVTLEFFDAPNPEEIRRFIYHVRNQ